MYIADGRVWFPPGQRQASRIGSSTEPTPDRSLGHGSSEMQDSCRSMSIQQLFAALAAAFSTAGMLTADCSSMFSSITRAASRPVSAAPFM